MASPSALTEPTGLDLVGIQDPAAWDRVSVGYSSYIAAHLRRYAIDALQLAGISEHDEVLDVATGPGTLALEAARVAQKVNALDFSAGMLEALYKRTDEHQRARLSLRQGDGQALPYANDSFDAAFSMFGLFMFPDRAKGFAELARVLRPGGRAVVASWQPQDAIHAFMVINTELAAESSVSRPSSGPPLGDPVVFKAEMEAAGFDVEIHPIVHVLESPSFDALWDGLTRSHVALEIAREQLGSARYADLLARIRARLEQDLGSGPQSVAMPAWLGLGRLG
ncbi:2-heptaprenyl-1,4-naphthoquinone methyltransferase [Enhygromyxa salina]|uniref:2-heptaprenyl-1,4-naphthoquinone methyltransferase n=1 Tax=Enhygromyxa salina TaxID=215803 RepID=A0A0C2A281_9BACT|nr:methyltransferase domain-containing protein [Enhygromyxa salina]KIG17513.1 2-heptaprenyl-1,4-naphthoquinone methyltransferase [Enhygromyxa salina]